MKITFIGHRDFIPTEKIRKQLRLILDTLPKNENLEFYLGGYGNFDFFAKNFCAEYKTQNNLARLYFVTPYLSPSYLASIQQSLKGYDQIISLNGAETPRRYSIIKRNYEMIKLADLIVACVNFQFGGAYKSFLYAKKLKKEIINLGTL